MDKQPTFSDRRLRIVEAAKQLEGIAELLLAEAEHMAAAEKRFAERRQSRTKASR